MSTGSAAKPVADGALRCKSGSCPSAAANQRRLGTRLPLSRSEASPVVARAIRHQHCLAAVPIVQLQQSKHFLPSAYRASSYSPAVPSCKLQSTAAFRCPLHTSIAFPCLSPIFGLSFGCFYIHTARMPTRRSHNKTRLGCGQCKKRRIKVLGRFPFSCYCEPSGHKPFQRHRVPQCRIAAAGAWQSSMETWICHRLSAVV
jgi:hypothetical protein